MINKWKSIDTNTLNKLINKGNTLRLDFTEREFLSYRFEVMTWLASYWKDKGEHDLSDKYYFKTVDIIDTDGNIAHVENNMDDKAKHAYRQSQLIGILSILSDYEKQTTVYWSSIRSWLSLVVAVLSIVLTIVNWK